MTPVLTATAAAIELLAACPGCVLVDQLPVDMAYAMNLLIWWVSKYEIIDAWMLAMLRGVLLFWARYMLRILYMHIYVRYRITIKLDELVAVGQHNI